MNALVELAYAKLNLALHVRGRRDDGYHDIETLFAFCEDGDELAGEGDNSLSLTVAGPFATSLAPGSNLVLDAARALQNAHSVRDGAQIRLTKLLPVAAGVGGGSADAAATLRLLNKLWSLELDDDALERVARPLGADVPACLRSIPALGSGTGDRLELLETSLTGTPVLLVNPRVELATRDVFACWDGRDRGPLKDWRLGRNDLEEPAMTLVPQIRGVIAWLAAQSGTELVRMSGSGATCFAIFDSETSRDQAFDAVPREWWRLATRLR